MHQLVRLKSLKTLVRWTAVIRVPTVMVLLFSVVTGCDQSPVHFEANVMYMRNQKLADDVEDFEQEELQNQVADLRRAVELFFGTPNEPRLPAIDGWGLQSLFDLSLLKMAAGPRSGGNAGSDRGLYRSLCARCHGVTGDGIGPEAGRHDPYPRDFRRGIFKFKRTASIDPPTDEDLHNVLLRGVPGTAMPSFRLLTEVERTALVQYVRYLTIRGLFERAVIADVLFDLGEDQRLLDPQEQEIDPRAYEYQVEFLVSVAEAVLEPWIDVDALVVEIPARPEDYGSRRSVARGRELFFTTLTNCATCHGDTALGDGQTDDYDEWTKEIEPTSPAAVGDYLALGALPPRKTKPRNLREGVFRGGRRPEEIFQKVKNGIAGTTMPSVATQLSDDDIWHLVAFARYLPFDPIGRVNATDSSDSSAGAGP